MALNKCEYCDGVTPITAENLNAIQDAICDLEQAVAEGGGSGEDGYSPTATVEQTDTGATITITDKDGTTTATITNGKDGQDGQNGQDGQDGYTPIKGTDYFDGADGSDGKDGNDGVSPTVEVTETEGGHRVTITDADGTQSFDVLNGVDGYTPIKGTDYFDGVDGKDGAAGADGKSAYAYAQDGGYAGTEAEFAADLARVVTLTSAEEASV